MVYNQFKVIIYNSSYLLAFNGANIFFYCCLCDQTNNLFTYTIILSFRHFLDVLAKFRGFPILKKEP